MYLPRAWAARSNVPNVLDVLVMFVFSSLAGSFSNLHLIFWMQTHSQIALFKKRLPNPQIK